MANSLADIDELVLRCRDAEARRYITEAVQCYKAGAYRACIILTWIALVYDYLHKLRELDLTGDKQASEELKLFQEARESSNTAFSQKFERELLENAKTKFLFINNIEFDELTRLRDDRHRCAHPSMVSGEDIFEPSAESARYHLRNVLVYLLQFPAVQGKSALARVVSEVNSDYFPRDAESAKAYLGSGPLANPKTPLLNAFLDSLIVQLVDEINSDSGWLRITAAFNGVCALHRAVTHQYLTTKFSKLLSKATDPQLDRVLRLIRFVSDSWQFLDEDIRKRLESYLRHYNGENPELNVHHAFDIPALIDTAQDVLNHFDEKQVASLIRIKPRIDFIERALSLYASAKSFNHANELGLNIIVPLIHLMSYEHAVKLINLAIPPLNERHRNQVFYSSVFREEVLPQLKKTLGINDDEFNRLISPLQSKYPDDYLWVQLAIASIPF